MLNNKKVSTLGWAVQIMEESVQARPRLLHGKLMSVLRTLSHLAPHRRGTAGAGDRPSVCYVEGEPAFATSHRLFSLRIRSWSLSLNRRFNQISKTFLGVPELFDAEGLATFKTTKYYTSEPYRICLRRKASLRTKC